MSEQVSRSLRVVAFTDVHALIVPMLHRLLSAHGHKLVGVVTGPGPKSRRSDVYLDVVRSTPPGIDVIVTTHVKRLPAMLEPFNADLFWVMGFLRVLPDELINMPPLGTINTHGGILPRYRGPNPPGWRFRDDAGEIGWTIHRMTSVLDGGPILAQASVVYGDEDDWESIVPRWAALVPELTGQALQRVAAGDPGEPQDESQAGYAGLFEPEWRQIDWSRPAREVHNQVRSWVGERGVARGAFGTIGGAQRLIIKTQIVPSRPESTAAPGTLLEHDDDALLVQCGDGPLRIIRWQDVAEA